MSFTGCRSLNWVTFDGGEYQVLALTGTSVRLRSTDGPEMVVLAAYLMAAPEFAVIDASRLFAAVYPEAVRLAGLIASPT